MLLALLKKSDANSTYTSFPSPLRAVLLTNTQNFIAAFALKYIAPPLIA
jgi:hypothetical protein